MLSPDHKIKFPFLLLWEKFLRMDWSNSNVCTELNQFWSCIWWSWHGIYAKKVFWLGCPICRLDDCIVLLGWLQIFSKCGCHYFHERQYIYHHIAVKICWSEVLLLSFTFKWEWKLALSGEPVYLISILWYLICIILIWPPWWPPS